MDFRELQARCEQLTKILTPIRVDILEYTDNSFTLRVVSRQFQDLSILHRSDLLSNVFENQAEDIVNNYNFDFEAWTPEEFAQLEGQGKISNTSQSSPNTKAAAKSPEAF